MSEINSFSDYTNKYNTNQDYSYLFAGMAGNTASVSGNNMLSDYASIKNGSYGKLLKAYYAQQKSESASVGKDTSQRSAMIRSSADTLKKAADRLNDDSLWQKKKITKKDEKTGETTETEDYDWDAITKAVKSFVDGYNSTIKEAGESNSKNVLRNALFMTNSVSKSESILSKVGITIGSGNKLELDTDKLKEADIGTLKNLFTGHISLGSKVSQKANSISLAAGNSSGAYTSKGTYSQDLSSLVSGKIDKEV